MVQFPKLSFVVFKHKKASQFCEAFVLVIMIWCLSTFPHVIAVSWTVRGLTALFGMGRGEHPPYGHHKILSVISFSKQFHLFCVADYIFLMFCVFVLFAVVFCFLLSF